MTSAPTPTCARHLHNKTHTNRKAWTQAESADTHQTRHLQPWHGYCRKHWEPFHLHANRHSTHTYTHTLSLACVCAHASMHVCGQCSWAAEDSLLSWRLSGKYKTEVKDRRSARWFSTSTGTKRRTSTRPRAAMCRIMMGWDLEVFSDQISALVKRRLGSLEVSVSH